MASDMAAPAQMNKYTFAKEGDAFVYRTMMRILRCPVPTCGASSIYHSIISHWARCPGRSGVECVRMKKAHMGGVNERDS